MGDQVAYCSVCNVAQEVSTIKGAWTTKRYAPCGHVWARYQVNGQPVVKDDGRFRPGRRVKKSELPTYAIEAAREEGA